MFILVSLLILLTTLCCFGITNLSKLKMVKKCFNVSLKKRMDLYENESNKYEIIPKNYSYAITLNCVDIKSKIKDKIISFDVENEE